MMNQKNRDNAVSNVKRKNLPEILFLDFKPTIP